MYSFRRRTRDAELARLRAENAEMRSRIGRLVEEKAVLRDRLEEMTSYKHTPLRPRYLVIILEKHPVSGYEPRHHRRKPDDVLTHTEQRRQRITFGAATVAVAAVRCCRR